MFLLHLHILSSKHKDWHIVDPKLIFKYMNISAHFSLKGNFYNWLGKSLMSEVYKYS